VLSIKGVGEAVWAMERGLGVILRGEEAEGRVAREEFKAKEEGGGRRENVNSSLVVLTLKGRKMYPALQF
jgi:hypothetical protein